MPDDSVMKVEDPRIVAAVEKYRNLLQLPGNAELLCDQVLEVRLPDEQRNQMLRALLLEERTFRRKQGLSTSFETYFSRLWFDKCIDDLVAVFLDKEYSLDARLGHGGQGRVYRVRNRAVHNRKEALKVFLPADPQYLKEFDNKQYLSLQARFDRESEALSRLRIDHLPTVHTVGNKDGLRYFTMEYIDGSSLAKRLEQERMIDPRQAANWMLTVAETLQELHAAKILHRDLKPSNLILNEKEKLYIVDFGLVKLMPGANANTTGLPTERNVNLTLSHGYGSRGFVSPEQSMNASQVTPATDIYSLGATLFNLLNGFPYLSGGEDGPKHWLPHVPEALRQICRDCLHNKPEDRPPAEKVSEALRAWLNREEKSTRVSQTVQAEVLPSRRRLLYFLAGGLAVAGAGGVLVFTRERIYSLFEINARAHDLRERLTRLLLDARTLNGGGFHTGFDPSSPTARDALTIARNVAALVSSAELPPEELPRCVDDLLIPFSEKEPETQIQTDRQGRSLGWSTKNPPTYTFFDPIAWMTIAQAKLLNRLHREEVPDQQLIRTVETQIEKTQPLFGAYFDSKSGGWLFFPNSTAAEPTSIWSTTLALQMLAELKKGGVSLGKNAPSGREDLISKAKKWLLPTENDRKLFHWSFPINPTEATDRALTLRVFSILGATFFDTDIPSSPSFLTELEAAATEFVLTYRDRPPTESSTELTYQAVAKTLAGDTKNLEEKIIVRWYPLVVSLLQSLISRAAKRNVEEGEVRPLRQFLGHLVVKIGEETLEKILLSNDISAAAEMLLGLSNVKAG